MSNPHGPYHIKTYNVRLIRKKTAGDEVLLDTSGPHVGSFLTDSPVNARVNVNVNFETETHLIANIEIEEL